MTARLSRATLLLACAALIGLTACDQSEQNIQWRSGESLNIVGPVDSTLADASDETVGALPSLFVPRAAPADPLGPVYFYVQNPDSEDQYAWFVNGEEVESTVNDEEFLSFLPEEPGAYTVAVETDQYRGEKEFRVAYPLLSDQAGRFAAALGAALEAAELTDTLGTEGPFTVLAPTDEAFAAVFDTSGNDAVETAELPSEVLLGEILRYHVIPDSLPASAIQDGDSPETLAGSEITFSVTGEDISVIDGTDLTEPAEVTEANIPARNGLVHLIDRLRLPPAAAVDFPEQAATDGGRAVNVRSVYVPRDGYVAIHDSTLLDDPPAVAGSVIGVSEYLEAGVYNNVEVTLFEGVPGKDFDEDQVLTGSQTLIAMPHEETSGNETYDFVASGGSADGAYTEGGNAVTDQAVVTGEEEEED